MKKAKQPNQNTSQIFGSPETPLEIAKRHHKDHLQLNDLWELLLNSNFFDVELNIWKDELLNNIEEKLNESQKNANHFYNIVLKPKK
jgi:hypothetical protein